MKSRVVDNTSALTFLFKILGLVVLSLLVFGVFKKVISGGSLTFEGFLNWLGSVNSMPLSVNIADFTIKGEWVILDGIRQFINALGSMVGVCVFLGANLINLFLFLSQFVLFLFA